MVHTGSKVVQAASDPAYHQMCSTSVTAAMKLYMAAVCVVLVWGSGLLFTQQILLVKLPDKILATSCTALQPCSSACCR